MATTHLLFNDQLPHGRFLRRWLNAVEEDLDLGDDLVNLFPKMIDGDGSSIAHFDEVVKRFGVGGYTSGEPTDAQRTVAKAIWDEFQSAWSKESGNGSVSDVNGARKQIIAKLR